MKYKLHKFENEEVFGLVKEIVELLKIMECSSKRALTLTEEIINFQIAKTFLCTKTPQEGIEECIATASSFLTKSPKRPENSIIFLSSLHKYLIKHKSRINLKCLGAPLSITEELWRLICHPLGTISVEFLYAVKRVYWLFCEDGVAPMYAEEVAKGRISEAAQMAYDKEWLKESYDAAFHSKIRLSKNLLNARFGAAQSIYIYIYIYIESGTQGGDGSSQHLTEFELAGPDNFSLSDAPWTANTGTVIKLTKRVIPEDPSIASYHSPKKRSKQ